MFMEARKSFMDPGAFTSQNQILIVSRKEKLEEASAMQDSDPTVLTSFMHTCMKFLWDQKEGEGLQELIDKYARKDKPLPEQHVVNRVNWSKKRIGREMQLTM